MKVLKIIGNIIFVLILALSGLFFLAHFTKVLPLRIFIVTSGSMEPAIKTGSLAFVRPATDYKLGDIVTFKTGPKNTTTHRLVAIGDGKYKTAGDANDQPDSTLITADQILGKVFYIVPYLGYLSAFAKTPPGFILFVIVPATIIVYEELKSLLSQIKKAHISSPIKPVFIILPIFFAAFILITVKSISYFSDTETSSNNSFTAFVTTPTPTPQPEIILINEVYHKGSEDKEWVELYNPTSSPINISGWSLTDNFSSDTFPATSSVIPAGGFAVVVPNVTLVSGIPASALTIILTNSTIGNGLADGGDHLILKNSSSTTVDQMSYGGDHTVFNPDPSSTGNDKSIARHPNGVDTDTAADWVSNTTPLTLGTTNP